MHPIVEPAKYDRVESSSLPSRRVFETFAHRDAVWTGMNDV